MRGGEDNGHGLGVQKRAAITAQQARAGQGAFPDQGVGGMVGRVIQRKIESNRGEQAVKALPTSPFSPMSTAPRVASDPLMSGVMKRADALDALRAIGSSAGQGAQDIGTAAGAAATGAATGGADYLKTHPQAALAATAGAGYLGYRGLKRGARAVGKIFRGVPEPPASLGSRLFKALRGVE